MSSVYHILATGNLAQDWNDKGLLSIGDDWTSVPSIVGYRGDELTSLVGADPQIVLGNGTPLIDVNANQTNPNTFTTGGVAEFEFAETSDHTVALSGSGTADAPNLVIHLDATGREEVTVSYVLRDIESTADNALQSVALQYRLGEAGSWVNLPAGYVADATTAGAATQVTPVSVTLPSEVNGEAQVQVRIITTNAAGSDEWVGVDNIQVTSQPTSAPLPGVTVTQSDSGTTVAEGGTTDTFSVVLSTQPSADVTITLSPDSETTVSPASLTFTPADWNQPRTVTVAAVDDAKDEGASQPSTIKLAINSADAGYASLTLADVVATVQDDDTSVTRISAIQGTTDNQVANPVSGHDAVDGSPLKGQIVTVEAIVVGDFQSGDADTSRDLRGFYIQEEDADADGNASSSEGIFVFDPNLLAGVKIGDKVTITGRVDESFGETQINVASIISGASVRVVSSGNALPTAAAISLPAADTTVNQNGIAQPDLEAYEGMLVTVPETLTISEQFQLDRFNEIKLFATEGFEQAGPDGTTITGERPFTYTQYNDPNAAGYQAYQARVGSRTITYDDGLNTQNQPVSGLDGFEGYTTETAPRMGDTINGLTGVLDYKFAGASLSGSTWRIRANEEGQNEFEAANPRVAEPVLADGSLQVASFNVLNFFTTLNASGARTELGLEPRGANTAEELARQTDKLVDALLGLDADVIGLLEIENDFRDAAGETTPIQTLVNALNAAVGSNVYAYVDPGVDHVGGDAIAVAMIYRTDKVEIAPGTVPAILTDDQVSGELVGQSTVGGIFEGANTSRSPMAVTFQELGGNEELLTVVINHLKSKGGTGTGEDADQGDGAGSWTNQRELAVQALSAWLETNPTGSPTANQLLIGDFNAYAEESAIDFLTETSGYVNVAGELLDMAYSYLFDGQLGTLDYAFASLELFDQVVDALEWHINSDEADVLDYNTDFGRDRTYFDGDTPYRASDHDPILVSLDLDGTGPTLVSATPADDATEIEPAANIVLTFSETVTAGQGNITVTNGAGDVRVIAVTDPQVTISGSTVTINPTKDLLEGETYDVLVEDSALTDASGNSFAGLAPDAVDFTVDEETFVLQILHASDFEAGLAAVDRAANFAAIVDYLEETHANSITLSSGDNYLPSPFFSAGSDASLKEVYETALEDYYGLAAGTLNIAPGFGTADISMLNIIGVEASAIGNHEFDAGTNPYAAIIRQTAGYPGAQLPYLSANIDFRGDPNLNPLFDATVRNAEDYQGFPPAAGIGKKIAPATIINENGERIGVIGATTQIVEGISSTGGIDIIGDDVDDMPALAAILQPTIDGLIARGIDKIVLVSHLQQLALEKELATLLKGVDVIVAGGSHTLLADGTDTLRPGDTADDAYPLLATGADGKSTVIVNTDSEYSYVGRLVVEFDENGDIITDSIDREVSGAFATTDDVVTDLYADPLDIDGDGDLDSDPFISGSRGDLVQDIADGVGAVIDAQDSNVFGQTDVYLEGRRGEVRTEETNLGNLSADANLWYAQKADSTVLVSIKNGGGIRDSIGWVEAVGDDVDELPPLANPEVGKEQGEVSELDISNALRFNNALTMLTLTPEQIKIVLEHAVAAVAPGATPGQFAQVGGIAFSLDAKAQGQVLNTTNDSVVTAGQRVQSAAIVDEDGNRIAIIKDGQVLDGAPEAIRVVTLTFLVSDPDGNGLGGDNYPFAKFIQENATFADRVDLSPDTSASDDVAARTGDAKFTDDGFEQDALAEYLAEFHSATPYGSADGGPATDERIQNLAAREDTVLPDGLPKVQDDKGTVAEDAGATFDLLANDSDPEGGDLTLAGFEVTAVAGVALSLANAREAFRVVDDQIVFDPGSRFQALNSGEAATVTLRYTASDGGDTTQGEFVLTVTGETDYVALSGTNRSETFVGTAGNDLIDVRNGDDTVRAAGGFDLVNGGNGRDAIFGGAGNDLLNGQEGNDRIVGDEGADVIAGGGGDDDLSGGAGADVFRFVPGDGKDTVSGFEAGQGAGDVIELVLSEFSDFANLFATGLRDTSRGAELRYSDGSRMTLLGVDADDLRANDFLFV